MLHIPTPSILPLRTRGVQHPWLEPIPTLLPQTSWLWAASCLPWLWEGALQAETQVHMSSLQICTLVNSKMFVRHHTWSCEGFSTQKSNASLPTLTAGATGPRKVLWPSSLQTWCLLRCGQSFWVGVKPSISKGQLGYTKVWSRESSGLCFALIQACWTWFSMVVILQRCLCSSWFCVRKKRDPKVKLFNVYPRTRISAWKWWSLEVHQHEMRAFYLPARQKHLPEKYLTAFAFRQPFQWECAYFGKALLNWAGLCVVRSVGWRLSNLLVDAWGKQFLGRGWLDSQNVGHQWVEFTTSQLCCTQYAEITSPTDFEIIDKAWELGH